MREYMLDQIDEDDYWDAWYALPLYWRDWLLWYVPGWWSLPGSVFRRVLLRTAYLIVRRGLSPSIALRQVATRLRLPPPRPTRRMPHHAPRTAPRPIRRAPIVRAAVRAPIRTAVRRSPVMRSRFVPRYGRGGGFRGGVRGGGFRPRFR